MLHYCLSHQEIEWNRSVPKVALSKVASRALQAFKYNPAWLQMGDLANGSKLYGNLENPKQSNLNICKEGNSLAPELCRRYQTLSHHRTPEGISWCHPILILCSFIMPTLAQRCILTKGSQTEWIRIRFPFPISALKHPQFSLRPRFKNQCQQSKFGNDPSSKAPSWIRKESMILVEGLKMRAPQAEKLAPVSILSSLLCTKSSWVKVEEMNGSWWDDIFQVPLFKLTTAFRKNSWPPVWLGIQFQNWKYWTYIFHHIPVERRWVPVGALLPNGFVQKWSYLDPLKLGMLSMGVPHFRKPIHPSDEFPSRHVKEVCSRVSEVQTVTSPETVPKSRTWGTEDQLGSLVLDSLVWININKSGMMCICGYGLIMFNLCTQ